MPADQVVQALHAALEAGIHLNQNRAVPSHLVFVSVGNETELLSIQERLVSSNLQSIIFNEPDLGNRATALATESLSGSSRNHLRNLPLWKPVSKENQ